MRALQQLKKIRFPFSQHRRRNLKFFNGKYIFTKANAQSKKYRTEYCKHSSQCKHHFCRFAHDSSELRDQDFKYESDPKYKEYQCKNLNCTRPKCKYYHDISEKRINILENNFYNLMSHSLKTKSIQDQSKSEENGSSIKQCEALVKKKLNISPLIPSLTYFNQQDLNNLLNKVLKVIKQMNENQKLSEFQPISALSSINKNHSKNQVEIKSENQYQIQNCINNVIINLCSRRSQISYDYDYALLNLLNKIPIISFKYKQFQYERNNLKGQLSYFIKTNVVVPFVCDDIKNIQPKSLKLDIRNLNNDWEGFIQLMQTIQKSSQSIHKLDINLQEFIGPKNVDDIDKIFTKILISLPQLKAINLRLQFNYLEDGDYERDIVDIFLELIQKLCIKNPSLQFQLNIFRIVIKYKTNNLEIFSEQTDRRKEHKRNAVNKMFKNSKLHEYFIVKFSEIFKINTLQTLKLNFSNLLMTQKKQDKVPKPIYEKEIECLLSGIQQIIQRLHDNCLKTLDMQFFGFFFHFEVQLNQKMLLFKFLMNFQLFFQNTPIVSIRCFKPFSELLNKKLMRKYAYSSFEGNLFTSKLYKKKNFKKIVHTSELAKRNEAKKKFIKLTTEKAHEFLNMVTNRFEKVKKISYFQNDSLHLNKILLQQKKKLTHTILLDPNPYNRSIEPNKQKIIEPYLLYIYIYIAAGEQNSLKGQLSYFIKNNIVIPFVCNDIKNLKSNSLKLDIRSLNNDWQSFVNLIKIIQNTSQSIHKLDINLQEFIGSKDINDIEQIFHKTLICIPQLKVINLRLQCNYLENGDYERDIIDVFLQLIEKLRASNRSLKFQLNIYRICIKKKNYLEIFSDKIGRANEYNRKIINKMFKNSKLHDYFLSKFSEVFRIREIKTLKIDFSNLFLAYQKQGEKSAQHIYENEIECLFSEIQEIVGRMTNNFLENLTMQFFGFFFHFQVQPKQKMLLFRFFMKIQLFFQNTPLVPIRNFATFSESLKLKLIRKKYNYSSFEGNLFTSKFYKNRKKEIKYSNEYIKDQEKKEFQKDNRKRQLFSQYGNRQFRKCLENFVFLQ
ncbi:hypothetical protein ABPG72_016973 [Tetrahymena utriculariae]